MASPEECDVCLIFFNNRDRRPRSLPCGHTFCTRCLGDILSLRSLSCPSCRTPHYANTPQDFPINYNTEELVNKLKSMESEASKECGEGSTQKKIKLMLHSLLEDQQDCVKNMILGCQNAQSHLESYRFTLIDWKNKHHYYQQRLKTMENDHIRAVELIQKEIDKITAEELKARENESKLSCVLQSIHGETGEDIGSVVDNVGPYVEEVEKWHQGCVNNLPDISTITTSWHIQEMTLSALDSVASFPNDVQHSKDVKASSVKAKFNDIMDSLMTLNLDELLTLRQPMVESGRVFCVQNDETPTLYSKISCRNGKLHIHCLQSQPMPGNPRRLVPMNTVLQKLDLNRVLVFMDLSWLGAMKGRIHIRLKPNTPMARQFTLLCTGQMGKSYLNTNFLLSGNNGKTGEWLTGGDYETNTGEGGAPLVNHQNHIYGWSQSAGAVWSWYNPSTSKSAQFGITTRACLGDQRFCGVFGEVESGLDVFRSAANHTFIRDVTVVDCGVVIEN